MSQTLRFLKTTIGTMMDKVHARHAAEVERLTSQLVALAMFPGQPPLAAGELHEAPRLLRAARLRQDWTLQEFLDEVNMSRSTLNRIENYRLTPSIATLERLAAALDLKLIVALVEADRELPGDAKHAAEPDEAGS